MKVFSVTDSAVQLDNHFSNTVAIWRMDIKHFKKFYRSYTGETLSDDLVEIYEARLLIVKMLLQTLVSDCEVVLDEIKKENP